MGRHPSTLDGVDGAVGSCHGASLRGNNDEAMATLLSNPFGKTV